MGHDKRTIDGGGGVSEPQRTPGDLLWIEQRGHRGLAFFFGPLGALAFFPGAFFALVGLLGWAWKAVAVGLPLAGIGFLFLKASWNLWREHGQLYYIFRGTSEGLRWGPTGIEHSLRFDDIDSAEHSSLLADSDSVRFHLKNGEVLDVGRVPFSHYKPVMEFVDQHIEGPVRYGDRLLKQSAEKEERRKRREQL